MWQCPGCSEQHEEQFKTCWRCGAQASGEHDPTFSISEPIDAAAQAPNPPVDAETLPSLELPKVTYFALPVYLWVHAAMAFLQLKNPLQNGLFSPSISVGEFVFMVVFAVSAFVIIGIPVFIRLCIFFCEGTLELAGRRPRRDATTGFFWVLSMFRLSADIRDCYRWFSPIYYGSFVAPVVIFIVVALIIGAH